MSTTGSDVGQVKELKMMKVDETAVKEHIAKIVFGGGDVEPASAGQRCTTWTISFPVNPIHATVYSCSDATPFKT